MVDPRILGGLLVFAGLSTAPVWYGFARGGGGPPELRLPKGECVEPVEYMRGHHMELLDRWRNAVVRDGERFYVSGDGRSYRMSLTGTCVRCHGAAAQFCDKCHQYAGVEAYCWDCHRGTP